MNWYQIEKLALRQYKERVFLKKLRRLGCYFIRRGGGGKSSHEIWFCPYLGKVITVPIKGVGDIDPNLANKIITHDMALTQQQFNAA
ncbi:hypothetical protein LCGC14_1537760 [marine sediment metagenome]|uniref:Type II toxin-antitoxin system HicA family toxin n=1 Tax=marine sediment metagenome TaxID=412755 RepID=A0A0F9IU15_9ZZZZ